MHVILLYRNLKTNMFFFADDDIAFDTKLLEDCLDTMHTSGADVITLATTRANQDKPSPVFGICGWEGFGSGCSVVKSRFLNGVNFDERFEFGFGEDSDFGVSLRKRGAVILYSSVNSILHYKAPIGGFRFEEKKPWHYGFLRAIPSPTIILFYLKNCTVNQLKAYKVYYWLKKIVGAPFKEKLLMPFRWSKSIQYAKKLLKN